MSRASADSPRECVRAGRKEWGIGDERWALEEMEMEPADDSRMSPKKPSRFVGCSPCVCGLSPGAGEWEREWAGARGVASPCDEDRRRSGVRMMLFRPRPAGWSGKRETEWDSLLFSETVGVAEISRTCADRPAIFAGYFAARGSTTSCALPFDAHITIYPASYHRTSLLIWGYPCLIFFYILYFI